MSMSLLLIYVFIRASSAFSVLNLTAHLQSNVFMSCVVQAKHLREQAVGGGLTDDVRRRRAADLAMQMCAMMDMGDDSGDSDEED